MYIANPAIYSKVSMESLSLGAVSTFLSTAKDAFSKGRAEETGLTSPEMGLLAHREML